MRRACCTVVCALALLPSFARAQQQEPFVEIVAPAVLPGIGVPRDRLPANVQVLRGRELEELEAENVPEALQLRFPGVNVNEIQGNPFQPDVSFRGFAASPLLGTPQGLSVYQDGVRVNEPFGDIVNWDLIPQAAIDSLMLVPGSNPLFGLNTLGGALAVRTKSGDTHPGATLELSGGSFNRRVGQLEVGAPFGDGLHGYAAATLWKEDGWRDYSPSELRQFFGKLGRRSGALHIDLSLTYGDTDLIGNGLVPPSFSDRRREAIFTRPDNTRHRMHMATLNGTYLLDDDAQLAGTLYYRRLRSRTLNGDVNDEFEDGPNDLAAGGTGQNAGTAASNRTATRQSGYGGVLQWSLATAVHRFAVGVTHDRSRSDFEQSSQLGIFDATRAVIETDPPELENGLHGRTAATGLFATDTWSLREDLHLTASGRYNRASVSLRDTGPSAPALDGEHRFSKFNPALGLAYQPRPALTLYGGFSQGNRAPSPIELGCADPQRPCTLPNALAADPPLKQVVARSFEFGVRGRTARTLRWNAGVFQTVSSDDILFVGTTTSAGYFTNFGRTRRRGLELGVSGAGGPLQWRAAYSFIRAEFRSNACIVSENNSSRGTSPECSPADQSNPGTFLGDDLISVQPGNRIPGIPEQSLKLALAYRPSSAVLLGAELMAFSNSTCAATRTTTTSRARSKISMATAGLSSVRARLRAMSSSTCTAAMALAAAGSSSAASTTCSIAAMSPLGSSARTRSTALASSGPIRTHGPEKPSMPPGPRVPHGSEYATDFPADHLHRRLP